MSDNINVAIISGRLGADPDLRYAQSGQAVLNLRVACTTSYVDKNKERKESTNWLTCVVFGTRAEALAKRLAKGMLVSVQGSLRVSSYDDREGKKVWKTELMVDKIDFSSASAPATDGDGYNAHAAPPAQPSPRGAKPQGKHATPPADDFNYGGDGEDGIPF